MSYTSNYITILLICFGSFAFAQVGIGNTDPKATLDISASNVTTPSNSDGILIPRMNNFPVINPTANQDGMLIFITGNGVPSKGFYYWNNSSTNWVSIKGIEKINDLTDGKSDNDGTQNGSSIFLGIGAGLNDDETDNQNVGIGYNTLLNNTTGNANTAIGYQNLLSNTSGSVNVSLGFNTLYTNDVGYRNVAIGQNTLYYNESGSSNVGIGTYSLENNTTGRDNIAIGGMALNENISGEYNTGIGQNALRYNINGNRNTALGVNSLLLNLGSSNTGLGEFSGSNSSSSNSIYIGPFAGRFNTIDNTLWIDNSSADADAALIYGEFDNDILRTNSQFQIGNPVSSGYAFPTTDGLVNQILSTNGNGQISFIDASSIFTDTDDQIIDAFNLNGTNLELSLQNDGVPTEVLDLSSLQDGTGDDWALTGNSGTNSTTNFIGTTDNQELTFRVFNSQKLRLTTKGQIETLNTNRSVFIGELAGENYTGVATNSVGIGYQALTTSTSGINNTAVGFNAMQLNISGFQNVAVGNYALSQNTTGRDNTASGNLALSSNTSGVNNTGVGGSSLTSNTLGSSNTALGRFSLYNNTSGSQNVGIGYSSGYNSLGDGNVFLGFESGYNENGSNKLYIENSNADANNALIYGEFDNDILRTNGILQIGNPTTTGYAFPTTDGAANQVLQTDGNGSISWSTASSISGTANYIPKFSSVTTLIDSQIYDSGTNVGIGTTAPSEKLSVDGMINLNESITTGIAIKVNGDEALWYNGSRFSWGFGGTQNYFADNVGIGINSPSYKLDVRTSNAANYVAQIYNTSANTEADGLKIRIGTPPPGTNNYFIGFYGGNDVLNGRISGNGAVGTIYSTVSDKRLKQNITKISNALEIIDKMNPTSYQFIVKPNISEYGFIAQELQSVLPQAVTGDPNGDAAKEPMMVDYSRLTPILTAGLKELHQLTKQHQQEIEILKQENKTLKQIIANYKHLEQRLKTLESSTNTEK